MVDFTYLLSAFFTLHIFSIKTPLLFDRISQFLVAIGKLGAPEVEFKPFSYGRRCAADPDRSVRTDPGPAP